MARPRRQSAAAWQPCATMIEPHFAAGVVSDADSGILAPGQTIASTNWMMDKAGKIYKRGGSAQVGGTCSDSGIIWVTVAEFPAPGTAEVLAWSSNHSLYKLSGGTWSSVGLYGDDTGSAPRMKPVVVADVSESPTTAKGMMVYGAANGVTVPRVYRGAGEAPRPILAETGLGVPTAGRYVAFYKGRLVLAASTTFENRMWFSPDITTGLETDWFAGDGANRFIDFDYNITGMAALQNIMLVFSRNHTVRLTGSAPPPGGNMSEGPLGDVGCTDSRSIAIWNDAAIWGNTQGVYMSNGTGLVDLTLEGGIKDKWNELIADYNETVSQIVGVVHHTFYVVTVQNSATWICDIPRRVWWQVTPSAHGNSYATDPLKPNSLYVSDGFPRVVDWGPFWNPSASHRLDIDGTPPVAYLSSRDLHDGQVGLKAWRDARLHNRLVSASSEAEITVVTGSAADGLEVAEATIPEGMRRERTEFELGGGISEGINLNIAQLDACDLCEVYNAELDYRPLPLSRGGAA